MKKKKIKRDAIEYERNERILCGLRIDIGK